MLYRTMLFLTGALLLSGCAADNKSTKPMNMPGCSETSCCGACMVPASTTRPTTQTSLSQPEKDALQSMRREEKLAHDVYIALAKRFPLRQFQHIPQSEVQHQRVVASLLASYGLNDAVASLDEGKFDQPDWQKLYDDFVARGSASESTALAVGVEIEELDISDLRKLINASNQPTVRSAMLQLEQASGNHLRAFSRGLQMRGQAYSPKHLSKPDFDAIIAGK